MTTCAYWCLSENVGDRLTPWIIERITGKRPTYVEPSFGAEHHVLAGSILNHAQKGAVVWGAGIATLTDGVNVETDIRAVRGPISRARALSCGARCPAVYGDPGLLVSRWIDRSTPVHPMGVVPHYVDEFRARKWWGQGNVVSALQDVEPFVQAVTRYHRIVSSSLHGIIIAHAYGIPAAWVKLSDSVGGDGTKFRDYYASVGLDVPFPVDMRNGAFEVPQDAFTAPENARRADVAGRLWEARAIQ